MSDEQKPVKPGTFQKGNQVAKGIGRKGKRGKKSIYEYARDKDLHKLVVDELEKLIRSPDTTDTARSKALGDLAKLVGGQAPSARELGALAPVTPTAAPVAEAQQPTPGLVILPARETEDALRKDIVSKLERMAEGVRAEDAVRTRELAEARAEVVRLRSELRAEVKAATPQSPPKLALVSAEEPLQASVPQSSIDPQISAERVKRAAQMDEWTWESEQQQRIEDRQWMTDEQWQRVWGDFWGPK
jgi:hypothetical protein